MRKNRGLFARVLMHIDMLSSLPDQLLVERIGINGLNKRGVNCLTKDFCKD